VGVSHIEPWPPVTAVQLNLAAVEATMQLAVHRPLARDEWDTITRLVDESEEQLRFLVEQGPERVNQLRESVSQKS
jgi:hypothetical protein